MPARLRLAHVPTPIERHERLSGELGLELFVKRDDATGGVEAGNKVRKLEFLLADALERGARGVVTCGAVQSNHCRATVAVAARLGLTATVLLRTKDKSAPIPTTGNAMLMRLAGARMLPISPDEYRERARLLEQVAAAEGGAYVIPEGGSSGLGSLGYVECMREIAEQTEAPFDVIVHACGSGGTAAGAALGAKKYGVAREVRAIAVCDDRAYFEGVIARLMREARALDGSLPADADLVVDDRWKGPAYGVASEEQRAFVRDVARRHGLFVDPVYTGKALFAIARLAALPHGEGGLRARRVLFLHTGGLPGLLAEGAALS